MKNPGTEKYGDYRNQRLVLGIISIPIKVVLCLRQSHQVQKNCWYHGIFPAHMCHVIPFQNRKFHHFRLRVESWPNKSNVICPLLQHMKCRNGSHWQTWYHFPNNHELCPSDHKSYTTAPCTCYTAPNNCCASKNFRIQTILSPCIKPDRKRRHIHPLHHYQFTTQS